MPKADVKKTIEILKEEYPDASIALNFATDFQLLVAVVLSAQCTDERVNAVTPALFKELPKVEDFAKCKLETLEKLIYSTGFYRAKARNIKAAAELIVDEFGGKVPSKMEDLLRIPGVARKTANVVLWTWFKRAEGIVVDTHVCRIAGLLGWVPMEMSKKKKAVQIERKLMDIVPKSDWGVVAHLLILHGRKICVARRPKCEQCPLNKICPSSFV